ncbi:hypothetical protein EHI46_00930 [Rhizobium leguminosarum]|nr:hypothetical protein EHI46_00930 [Rhizobium leguminosarum]
MAATFRFTPEPYRTRLTGQLAINSCGATKPRIQRSFRDKSLESNAFKRALMHPSGGNSFCGNVVARLLRESDPNPLLNLTGYKFLIMRPLQNGRIPLTPIWSHAIPNAHCTRAITCPFIAKQRRLPLRKRRRGFCSSGLRSCA